VRCTGNCTCSGYCPVPLARYFRPGCQRGKLGTARRFPRDNGGCADRDSLRESLASAFEVVVSAPAAASARSHSARRCRALSAGSASACARPSGFRAPRCGPECR
jgi:hypothetical protein